MKINSVFRLRLLAAAALCASAPSAMAETLEEAAALAVSTHPSIASAEANLAARHEEKREYFSDFFPSLSASTTAGRVYQDNATSRGLSVTRGAGYSGLWNGTVSAREKVFNGFETVNRVRAAGANRTATELDLAAARETVAYRTAQAYIELMRAREGLAMLLAHGEKVDDYLARIKKSVDEGAADETAHQQARDVRVILEGIVADYEGQARAAESNFFDLTGRMAEGTLVEPSPDARFIPASADEAVVYGRDRHPSILAERQRAEAASHDLSAERGPLYPDLEGELSYMKEDKKDLIGGESEDKRAVMRLNWDFDAGGAQLARIKRKKHEREDALSRAADAEKKVELGIRLAYAEHETALRQMENKELRRDLNEKLFDAYRAQFEGSKISLLQLMQAENQLFTADLEKMNAQYRLLQARYAILSSIGRLEESIRQFQTAAAAPESNVHLSSGEKAGPWLTGHDEDVAE